MQQIKLYDVGHWEHKQFEGFYQVGETVYNCDNRRQPLRKFGNAPNALLAFFSKWFTMEQAENDLRFLGFIKQDNIIWKKEQ